MKLIALSKYGKNRGKYFAKVDDSDFEWLNKYNWCAVHQYNDVWYAYSIINSKHILMHRLILGLTNPKTFGDHENHDGLDNQRHNLRIANVSQNGANRRSWANSSSSFLGVRKVTINSVQYWVAEISINKKSKTIGYFKSETDAAQAYDIAALRHHKEFANINFK